MNTLLSVPSGGTVVMLGGKFHSEGHNLFSDRPDIELAPVTDLTEKTPRLLPLADNGGPTWTHALSKESPARDAGVIIDDQPFPGPQPPHEPAGFGVDQRGISRPQGPAPDIGAFEYDRTVGDVNDDDRFNSSDLVWIFQVGKYETEEPALWSEGDWNGDGRFNSNDLVLAFQAGGYELQDRSTPHPSAAVVDWLFAQYAGPTRRRSRRCEAGLDRIRLRRFRLLGKKSAVTRKKSQVPLPGLRPHW